MRTHLVTRIAAVLVAVEGMGLLVLAGWQVLALVGGDTGSAVSAVALIVLTLIAAAAVIAFAVGVWRGMSWGRSGGIVTQLMILAVALGAATGTFGNALTGIELAIPALVTLVALVLAARRASAEQRADAASDDGSADDAGASR